MKGHCSLSKTKENVEGPEKDLVRWWNGGGGVRKRLSVNPGLKKFIAIKPDIWTYSESGLNNLQSLSLDGYKYFLHRSYLRDKTKCRTGMVLFYRQKHAQKSAKVFSSIKFDIVWLRLAATSGLIYICFFLCPRGTPRRKDKK